VKKVVAELTDARIDDKNMVPQAIATVTKMFLGELVETGEAGCVHACV
jgi:hypothetical protein